LYALSLDDAAVVSGIELKGHKGIKATNHDVKAVEYFIKEKLGETSLRDVVEWIHFGLTSEDVNNIAYGLLLGDALEKVIIPALDGLKVAIEKFARAYKNLPMLARTHGQPASPTTFGKEFKVFAARLERQRADLQRREIAVKCNGATGNYNAHVAAYPKVDWVKFTEDFVGRFNGERTIKLQPNLVTTQIEPHDTYAELFDNMRRINVILIDFNQDIWRYISDGWVVQKAVEGEVGSSAMPHKVNPIKFENSEGNLGVANTLFAHFSNKLPLSRLQRDLSDSTVERNFGVAFAHSLVSYRYLLEGLSKITIHEMRIVEELEKHPEVIAEAIQTILRREGMSMPYEELKAITRGREVTLVDLHTFIDSLKVSDGLKSELKRLTPKNYIGIANVLAERDGE
jgi:adenylosuccinate lyase